MRTFKFEKFLESLSRKTYTANIPHPWMTVECEFDLPKIREQFAQLPTPKQLYDACKDVKRRHMDSWLMKWFGSKLILPESDEPTNLPQPVMIDTLPDFINTASYIKQESLTAEMRQMLREMRQPYIKLIYDAHAIRLGQPETYESLVGKFNAWTPVPSGITKFVVLDVSDASDVPDEDMDRNCRVKLLAKIKLPNGQDMNVMIDWDNVDRHHAEKLKSDKDAVVEALDNCVALDKDEILSNFGEWVPEDLRFDQQNTVYCVVV